MATTDTKGAAESAAPAVHVEPVYYEITLSRPVSYLEFTYKPGIRHVVDEATLAGLGGAVSDKTPLKR